MRPVWVEGVNRAKSLGLLAMLGARLHPRSWRVRQNSRTTHSKSYTDFTNAIAPVSSASTTAAIVATVASPSSRSGLFRSPEKIFDAK